MDQFYIIHVPFFAIPVVYIISTFVTISLHCNDGTEHLKTSPSRLTLKLSACFLNGILEILHILDLSPSNYYEGAQKLVRTSYFSLTATSWFLSSFMVYFDFKRRIKCKWIGQKGFWIMSLIANTCLLTLNIIFTNILDVNYQVQEYFMIQTIIYSFAIFLEIFLSCCAIFKPNDFPFVDPYYNFSLQIIEDDLIEQQENAISVFMGGCKIKEQKSSSLIFFEIFVSVNGIIHKISRTYQEFKILNEKLLQSFHVEGISMPPFPNFHHRKLNLEQQSLEIGEYITAICIPLFFSEDLFDFLGIDGKIKENLLKNLRKTSEPDHSVSVLRSSSAIANYYDPKASQSELLPIFSPSYYINWAVNVKIPNWRLFENHVEYFIESEIKQFNFKSEIIVRYSEILALHKQLKKNHLPTSTFPTKSISQSFKHFESEFIEIRRSQLEEYLGCALNDPAYLNQIVLKFINCDLSVNEILELVPEVVRFELLLPVTWEWEISNDSNYFIVYKLKIQKTVAGKNIQWEVKRRFKEFDILHKILLHRNSSSLLKDYVKKELGPLPNLPKKSLAPLCSIEEIEERKKDLEEYLILLLSNPAVCCSYFFRGFLGEVE